MVCDEMIKSGGVCRFVEFRIVFFVVDSWLRLLNVVLSDVI